MNQSTDHLLIKKYGCTLRELVQKIPTISLRNGIGEDVQIHGIHHDSRRVSPGDLFVARSGQHADGTAFIQSAIAAGTVAVLCQAGSNVSNKNIPILEAPDVRVALAQVAAQLYQDPTKQLSVLGITGTNGKTSVSYLAQACILACGGKAGVIGTLGYRFSDIELLSSHTSPEIDDVTRFAAALVERGGTHLTMEVSSIALDAKRVESVHFKVAALTNLTQDHLDYHGTMERYANAKKRLFFDLKPEVSVVNMDDAFGQMLMRDLSAMKAAVIGYSVNSSTHTDVVATHVQLESKSTTIHVNACAIPVTIRSSWIGMHNVSNLLCALSMGIALGYDPIILSNALSQPICVPGRLERCDNVDIDNITVVVDYAHTPDALERVLSALRQVASGNIICVFGCGGDRDKMKRPIMGDVVDRLADVSIVTSDNPRSEDPQAILDAIVVGMSGHSEMRVEVDRAKAIEQAILDAHAGDVVLIAGKGHETYQIIGPSVLEFDDRQHARLALKQRRNVTQKETV